MTEKELWKCVRICTCTFFVHVAFWCLKFGCACACSCTSVGSRVFVWCCVFVSPPLPFICGVLRLSAVGSVVCLPLWCHFPHHSTLCVLLLCRTCLLRHFLGSSIAYNGVQGFDTDLVISLSLFRRPKSCPPADASVHTQIPSIRPLRYFPHNGMEGFDTDFIVKQAQNSVAKAYIDPEKVCQIHVITLLSCVFLPCFKTR